MPNKILSWLKEKLLRIKARDSEHPVCLNEVVNIMVSPGAGGEPRLARACPDTQLHRDVISYGFVRDVLQGDHLINASGKDVQLEGLDQQPIFFRGSITLQWYKLGGTRSHTTQFLVSMHPDPAYDILFSGQSSIAYRLLVPEPLRAWSGWLPAFQHQNEIERLRDSQETEKLMQDDEENLRRHRDSHGLPREPRSVSDQAQSTTQDGQPQQSNDAGTTQSATSTQNHASGSN
ncbi:MAG: hypothetical protein M1822_002301 [Bathelium mastoideum]|nr:MAG: hypothetical protein M1822_002301 [Bathelium mastoideum]